MIDANGRPPIPPQASCIIGDALLSVINAKNRIKNEYPEIYAALEFDFIIRRRDEPIAVESPAGPTLPEAPMTPEERGAILSKLFDRYGPDVTIGRPYYLDHDEFTRKKYVPVYFRSEMVIAGMEY